MSEAENGSNSSIKTNDQLDPMTLVQLYQMRAWFDKALTDKEEWGKFDPERKPEIEIESFSDVTTMHVGVSPDCSYRLVKAALEMAQNEIILYIFNISAAYLLDILRERRDKGVKIRLMYDIWQSGAQEKEKINALGVEAKEAPSSDGRQVFTCCHQKYAVIDGSILLLGSANWVTTGIPKVIVPGKFKEGNREWVVRIDHEQLASWFKTLFERDWNIPVREEPIHLIDRSEPDFVFTETPFHAVDYPKKVFDTQEITLEVPARVTPVISPDNYFTEILQLIEGAKQSIYIQQQNILVDDRDYQMRQLLTALRSRRQELDIRILVSPKYNWEASIKCLKIFNLEGNLRGLDLEHYTHLHNKGIIVDRNKVVVTSTNWSENSVTKAREAGVLIESAAIAEYYAQVFDHDWETGIAAGDVIDKTIKIDEETEEVEPLHGIVHPADLVYF